MLAIDEAVRHSGDGSFWADGSFRARLHVELRDLGEELYDADRCDDKEKPYAERLHDLMAFLEKRNGESFTIGEGVGRRDTLKQLVEMLQTRAGSAFVNDETKLAGAYKDLAKELQRMQKDA